MSEHPEQQDEAVTSEAVQTTNADQPDIPEDEEQAILPDLTTAEAGEQPEPPRDDEGETVAEPGEAQGDTTDETAQPDDAGDADSAGEADGDENDSDSKDADDKKDEPDITNPGKLVRLGHMHAKILEELKSADTDPAGRKRLAQIHENTIEAMKEALGQDLEDEFLSFTPKLSSYSTPSHSELLVAQAGLVGWIEGLLQSIQTAIMARQAMHDDSPANPEHPVKHNPEGAYGPGNYL
ncbi:type IV secretory pathway VirB10-like protein [Brevibacterium paucivorans]|uniref:Bacterial proteasome activator n=1 Tax=Brevibacterium paucivorans TaxID=170994 RepID=A0ABS2SK25_9MICO|nr:type IV secretory pathway VirB10-like protein [Brevibacterium paucivorans]